ncbi:flagellar hook-length control protein FliK [Dactylosporangium sp. NPDC000555]|uniref:flagellar hook-length control protein FliK n=1 Tax=Dactylosporangium sp. NPDC000555 TaxID=3154260 RepID=UPI0033249F88
MPGTAALLDSATAREASIPRRDVAAQGPAAPSDARGVPRGADAGLLGALAAELEAKLAAAAGGQSANLIEANPNATARPELWRPPATASAPKPPGTHAPGEAVADTQGGTAQGEGTPTDAVTLPGSRRTTPSGLPGDGTVAGATGRDASAGHPAAPVTSPALARSDANQATAGPVVGAVPPQGTSATGGPVTDADTYGMDAQGTASDATAPDYPATGTTPGSIARDATAASGAPDSRAGAEDHETPGGPGTVVQGAAVSGGAIPGPDARTAAGIAQITLAAGARAQGVRDDARAPGTDATAQGAPDGSAAPGAEPPSATARAGGPASAEGSGAGGSHAGDGDTSAGDGRGDGRTGRDGAAGPASPTPPAAGRSGPDVATTAWAVHSGRSDPRLGSGAGATGPAITDVGAGTANGAAGGVTPESDPQRVDPSGHDPDVAPRDPSSNHSGPNYLDPRSLGPNDPGTPRSDAIGSSAISSSAVGAAGAGANAAGTGGVGAGGVAGGGAAVPNSGGLPPGQAAWPSIAPQLVSVLSPLRRGADGVHRMTLRLRPEDLGPVSIVAEVRDGAIAVRLRADHEAGQAALRAALPELRQDLTDAGFARCALELHQQSSATGNGSQHFSGWRPEGRSQRRTPERGQAVAAPQAAGAEPGRAAEGLVDLRL